MKRALAAVLLLAIVASPALARKKKRMPASGGYGMFGPTVVFADFSNLNSELAKQNIDELNSLHWVFGGGGYAHINRVVLGGSGWGGTQTVASESLRVGVSLSGGHFEAGYSVINLRHLVVTPMLGIGASGYDVTLLGLLDPVSNFEELLKNPGRTSQISFTQLTVTPELAITVPVSFVGFQLKAGAAYSPMTPAWTLGDGAALIRGPGVASLHPFVNLSILFGGFAGGND